MDELAYQRWWQLHTEMLCRILASCFAILPHTLAIAQEPPRVLVTDSGVETATIGPGAPAHTIGLKRHEQTIVLDTAVQSFALRYVVARDPNNPQAAIPGEGYIGMPKPEGANWYASGFFDLRINGESVGKTLIHSLTGRSSEGRATADFVFDTSQAVVRVRFVAKAGGDCLFAQALLEPKAAIDSVRIALRCYPSAFVSDADRHVLTSTRDFAQGERAELDVATQWWTLYYDSIYDAGYIGPTRSGAGPCAALWLPGQTENARFSVASYGIETVLDLKPTLRDFRFVFFDYAGKKNEAAKSDLRGRAPALLEELATFTFTDPSLANWPLPRKLAEIRQVLASVPQDKDSAAQYEVWSRKLAAQLELMRSGAAGTIMAEAETAEIIGQWQSRLPALKLQALLNEI
ncbi:MAG: hypothetical protein GXY83_41355 [Rhodopirellula sp.]|nr:hypothetical protein [Rhodopirellula sp.]